MKRARHRILLPRVKGLGHYTTVQACHLADLNVWDVVLLPETYQPQPFAADAVRWHGPCRVTHVRETPGGYHIAHGSCREPGCGGPLYISGATRFHGARILT